MTDTIVLVRTESDDFWTELNSPPGSAHFALVVVVLSNGEGLLSATDEQNNFYLVSSATTENVGTVTTAQEAIGQPCTIATFPHISRFMFSGEEGPGHSVMYFPFLTFGLNSVKFDPNMSIHSLVLAEGSAISTAPTTNSDRTVTEMFNDQEYSRTLTAFDKAFIDPSFENLTIMAHGQIPFVSSENFVTVPYYLFGPGPVQFPINSLYSVAQNTPIIPGIVKILWPPVADDDVWVTTGAAGISPTIVILSTDSDTNPQNSYIALSVIPYDTVPVPAEFATPQHLITESGFLDGGLSSALVSLQDQLSVLDSAGVSTVPYISQPSVKNASIETLATTPAFVRMIPTQMIIPVTLQGSEVFVGFAPSIIELVVGDQTFSYSKLHSGFVIDFLTESARSQITLTDQVQQFTANVRVSSADALQSITCNGQQLPLSVNVSLITQQTLVINGEMKQTQSDSVSSSGIALGLFGSFLFAAAMLIVVSGAWDKKTDER